jgi:hypothetical protein
MALMVETDSKLVKEALQQVDSGKVLEEALPTVHFHLQEASSQFICISYPKYLLLS